MISANVATNWALASPLTLLMQEEAYGDRQAEEVLLLTFTSDLGFLESFALGPAQAAGARFSVVADAAMSTLDPRAARRAGRSYLPGLASTTGAFHPKLVIIAGKERATVAIGSGNATLAGWQANAELWSVLHAADGRCPAVFAELARWLRDLPHQIRLSEYAPEALGRCATLLDAHVSAASELTDPDVRLVSSLTEPIIDQLPALPVKELAVFAPFTTPAPKRSHAWSTVSHRDGCWSRGSLTEPRSTGPRSRLSSHGSAGRFALTLSDATATASSLSGPATVDGGR